MSGLNLKLSDMDLNFVVNEAAPDHKDKEKLKQLIREDQDFRKHLIGDEKVFKKVMADDEIIIKISPSLYFEILLRRAIKELQKAGHTIERVGSQRVLIFDSEKVVELLTEETILLYLADLLSSFTRIESFTVPVRVRKGVWRKIRFNDMDIDSLSTFSNMVDEEYKLLFYKRIADVCLFILGIFPEYVQWGYYYSYTGEKRPQFPWKTRKSADEYEEKGRKYYQLASEYETEEVVNLVGVFHQLAEHFHIARKPLEFIALRYLHFKKHMLFNL